MPDVDPSTATPREQSTLEALQRWREAGRTVAVARRGRLEPEAAASEAKIAAAATAEAAKAAFASMSLASAHGDYRSASSRAQDR